MVITIPSTKKKKLLYSFIVLLILLRNCKALTAFKAVRKNNTANNQHQGLKRSYCSSSTAVFFFSSITKEEPVTSSRTTTTNSRIISTELNHQILRSTKSEEEESLRKNNNNIEYRRRLLARSLETGIEICLAQSMLQFLAYVFHKVCRRRIFLGPLGSVTILQFAAKPSKTFGSDSSSNNANNNNYVKVVGETRIILISQLVSVLIGMFLTFIPGLPTIPRLVIAPALSGGAMIYLNAVHPPAGSASMYFASERRDWISASFYLLAVAFSVFTKSTIIVLRKKALSSRTRSS